MQILHSKFATSADANPVFKAIFVWPVRLVGQPNNDEALKQVFTHEIADGCTIPFSLKVQLHMSPGVDSTECPRGQCQRFQPLALPGSPPVSGRLSGGWWLLRAYGCAQTAIRLPTISVNSQARRGGVATSFARGQGGDRGIRTYRSVPAR